MIGQAEDRRRPLEPRSALGGLGRKDPEAQDMVDSHKAFLAVSALAAGWNNELGGGHGRPPPTIHLPLLHLGKTIEMHCDDYRRRRLYWSQNGTKPC